MAIVVDVPGRACEASNSTAGMAISAAIACSTPRASGLGFLVDSAAALTRPSLLIRPCTNGPGFVDSNTSLLA